MSNYWIDLGSVGDDIVKRVLHHMDTYSLLRAIVEVAVIGVPINSLPIGDRSCNVCANEYDNRFHQPVHLPCNSSHLACYSCVAIHLLGNGGWEEEETKIPGCLYCRAPVWYPDSIGQFINHRTQLGEDFYRLMVNGYFGETPFDIDHRYQFRHDISRAVDYVKFDMFVATKSIEVMYQDYTSATDKRLFRLVADSARRILQEYIDDHAHDCAELDKLELEIRSKLEDGLEDERQQKRVCWKPPVLQQFVRKIVNDQLANARAPWRNPKNKNVPNMFQLHERIFRAVSHTRQLYISQRRDRFLAAPAQHTCSAACSERPTPSCSMIRAKSGFDAWKGEFCRRTALFFSETGALIYQMRYLNRNESDISFDGTVDPVTGRRLLMWERMRLERHLNAGRTIEESNDLFAGQRLQFRYKIDQRLTIISDRYLLRDWPAEAEHRVPAMYEQAADGILEPITAATRSAHAEYYHHHNGALANGTADLQDEARRRLQWAVRGYDFGRRN